MSAVSRLPEPGEPRSHLPEFARRLRAARIHAGLTVRELGQAIGYSHSRIVRAARGAQLPTWELTSAYLTKCGVGDEALSGWQRLWSIARQTDKEFRLGPRLTADRVWFWRRAEQDWDAAVEATLRPSALVAELRRLADPDVVANPEEIGVAITALAGRTGSASVRGIGARTGVSKTTLHGWLTGTRTPTADQLDQLVTALGASHAERFAFAAAFNRVLGALCGEPHHPSGLRCVLAEFHRGYHRTASGREWLETGELDGVLTREYELARARAGLQARQ